MSERNQRVLGRDPPEADDWEAWALRMVQGFDHELDHTALKAAQCSGGLLAAMHGPCSLFRFSAIDGTIIDQYFEFVYAPPSTHGLMGANVQLAEDIYLAFQSALVSGKHLASEWDAVFEFEAELSLEAFMAQRRRWTNAAATGVVLAVFLPQICAVMRATHSPLFKLVNVLMIGVRLVMLVAGLFSPAVLGFIFAKNVAFTAWLVCKDYEMLAEVVEATVYGSLYASFVYVHLKRKQGDCVLNRPLLKAVVAHNGLMVACTAFGLIYRAVDYGEWPILCVPITVLCLPLVTAALSGTLEGVLILLRSIIVFTLAAPTFFVFVNVYGFARLADLSWGNRPCGGSRSPRALKTQDLEAWVDKQILRSTIFNEVLVLVNLLLIGVLCAYLVDIRPSQQQLHAFYGLVAASLLCGGGLLQLIGLAFHIGRLLVRFWQALGCW